MTQSAGLRLCPRAKHTDFYTRSTLFSAVLDRQFTDPKNTQCYVYPESLWNAPTDYGLQASISKS